MCWLMQKTSRSVVQQHQGGFKTFQQFLDNQQYTRRGILRYEKMFGSGYVSTGGPSTTKARIWVRIGEVYRIRSARVGHTMFLCNVLLVMYYSVQVGAGLLLIILPKERMFFFTNESLILKEILEYIYI